MGIESGFFEQFDWLVKSKSRSQHEKQHKVKKLNLF